MSEKLTVAELLARNAKAGGKSSSDRPRRHRNLEDGGVSVSELTGSIPVVKLADENGADAVADANSTPDTPVEARTTSIDDAEVQTAAIEVEPEPVEPKSVETEPVETEATTGQKDGEVPDVTPEITPEAALVDVPGDGPETETCETRAEPAIQQGAPTEIASEEAPAVTSAPATVVAPAAAADLSTDLSTERSEEQEQDPSQDQTPASRDDEIVEYEDDSVSWPALLGQSALAVVLGVLIFFGFTLLWDNLGTAMVLVMALVVTFVCVGVVHALLRHRDTILLALTFIVVIALTVGPRLIMSL